MLERDVRLAALTGGRYHAASLSCIESLEILKRARDAGLDVSASVSINHLTLNENDIGPYRTFLKLSPPLRTRGRPPGAGRRRRRRADRCRDERPQSAGRRGKAAAVRGIGLRRDRLQTMLPAALRLIHNGEMDFKTLIRAMSTRPAELLGLPGGSLRAGSAADVIVIDADVPWVLDPPTSNRNARIRRSTTPFLRPRGTDDRRRTDGL